jgi:hypothetical protein
MLNGLFWNVKKQPLAVLLRRLCDEYDIDLLMLAECNMSDEQLLPILNQGSNRTFIRNANDFSPRISFFIRLARTPLKIVSDKPHCSIRALSPPGAQEILIAAIHHRSKLHSGYGHQDALMTRTAEQIAEAESRHEHRRTLVVGDLNMNPFEPGICSADGLHAVMSKAVASRISRRVDGEERFFFYNPMWNLLGDETPGPPGTYYHGAGMLSYFWNTFDQVLLRPELLEQYRPGDVKILSEVGETRLFGNDRMAPGLSDHLPVFFKVRN